MAEKYSLYACSYYHCEEFAGRSMRGERKFKFYQLAYLPTHHQAAGKWDRTYGYILDLMKSSKTPGPTAAVV